MPARQARSANRPEAGAEAEPPTVVGDESNKGLLPFRLNRLEHQVLLVPKSVLRLRLDRLRRAREAGCCPTRRNERRVVRDRGWETCRLAALWARPARFRLHDGPMSMPPTQFGNSERTFDAAEGGLMSFLMWSKRERSRDSTFKGSYAKRLGADYRGENRTRYLESDDVLARELEIGRASCRERVS